MQKASPRLANIDGKTPTPEAKKENIKQTKRTNWRDSPHLISLKRGVEKHGKDWKYLINACNMNYETSRGTAGNKAGSGWNDRLAKIHKGSDPKKSTIRLK